MKGMDTWGPGPVERFLMQLKRDRLVGYLKDRAFMAKLRYDLKLLKSLERVFRPALAERGLDLYDEARKASEELLLGNKLQQGARDGAGGGKDGKREERGARPARGQGQLGRHRAVRAAKHKHPVLLAWHEGPSATCHFTKERGKGLTKTV